MAISVEVRTQGGELERYQRLLETLGNRELRAELLDNIGQMVERQTRRRIMDEKTAPDGTPWAPWSASYAKTRHGGNSLLMSGNGLLNSIEFQVEGDKVRIGSALRYAAVHQEGFDGAVSVSPHQRLITQAFGKALKFPVYQSVGSFARQMAIPARPFLGLSDENQTELLTVIGDFWQTALQEHGL